MKKIGIEKLLHWAYTQELPKEQVNRSFLRPQSFKAPWGAITKSGVYLTEIQESNRYGVAPDFTAQSGPHPDAVRVWDAVQDLEGFGLDLPPDWYPIADLGDLGLMGPAAVIRAFNKVTVKTPDGGLYLRRPIPQLVEFHVIMGAPKWEFERPTLKTEKMQDGRTRWFIEQKVVTETGSFDIEVDGFDYSEGLPKTGAYKKTDLHPDPMKAVIARIEYRVWHSALEFLAEDLAGRLDDHDITGPESAAEPWEGGLPDPPRMLKDSRAPQPAAISGAPKPIVGRPLPRSKKSRAEVLYRKKEPTR